MNEKDREVFGRNLTHYMNRNKITGVTLAKYMGVSSATVSDWMHGKKMPRVDKLKSLAHYFSTPGHIENVVCHLECHAKMQRIQTACFNLLFISSCQNKPGFHCCFKKIRRLMLMHILQCFSSWFFSF